MKDLYFKNTVAAVVLTLAALLASCSKKTAEPAPEQPSTLTVKSFSPKEAKVGTLVTIRGTGFGNEQSLVRIFFGGSEMVRPLQFSDTLMTAVVPPDASAGRITVSLMLGPVTQSDDIFNIIVDQEDYVNLNKIQFTGSGTLSGNKAYLAAAGAGNKILVTGGPSLGGLNTDYDIYDISNNTWESGRLSQPRTDMAVASIGNKILVVGGNVSGTPVKTVDIYDVVSNTWTTSQLSVARTGLAAVGAGVEVFCAGGYDENGNTSDLVEIYNVTTGKWRTAKLSVARGGLIAATTGATIVFAGGDVAGSTELDGRIVDIYSTDGRNAGWSTARLNVQRLKGLTAVGNARYIVFAGGANHDQDPFLEVYDATDNVWNQRRINEEIQPLASASAGTKLVFSYGMGRALIYDALTGTIVSVIHAGQTTPKAGAGLKNKMIFAGGAGYDQYTLYK